MFKELYDWLDYWICRIVGPFAEPEELYFTEEDISLRFTDSELEAQALENK